MSKTAETPFFNQYGRKAGFLLKKCHFLSLFRRLGKPGRPKKAPEADYLLSSREMRLIQQGHLIILLEKVFLTPQYTTYILRIYYVCNSAKLRIYYVYTTYILLSCIGHF